MHADLLLNSSPQDVARGRGDRAHEGPAGDHVPALPLRAHLLQQLTGASFLRD